MTNAAVGGDLWVFAYGSLMWNPGFSYLESQRARLRGFHRGFCVYSHHYRGTPEDPGLVLGLMPGGDCQGLAFRVAGDNAPAVHAYLDERELVTYAYRKTMTPVEIDGGAVDALTYVADPSHPQYAGLLDADEAARIIMRAEGCAGLNRDYLINTVQRLEQEGFTDAELHALLERIWRLTGAIEAGGGI
jgi:cation transport protein ChaC